MKTRTVIPLLYALSFLMVSAASSSAQKSIHPDYMEISLDSSQITYNMNQTGTIPQYTVHGSITSLMYAGSLTVKIKSGMQWVISTKISGTAVQDGDFISINVNGHRESICRQGRNLPARLETGSRASLAAVLQRTTWDDESRSG